MMKGLQRWAILVTLCFGIAYLLPAQRPSNTTIKQPTKTIKQPPVQIKTPVKQAPVKIEPEVRGTEMEQIKPPVKDMLLDMETLNQPLFVSQRYTRHLQDNGTYIDERGYHKMTFDIIKKQDGNFALVYGASTENLDIYSKGILMTLNPNLSQQGNAMIITQPDEELRYIKLAELYANTLSIVYTCNDATCLSTSGNNSGNRDNRLTTLKYTEVSSGGNVANRSIDDAIGQIQLLDLYKPSGSSDISVVYNLNGKGKIGLAGMYIGTHVMACDLWQLDQEETVFYGQPPAKVEPEITGASLMGNKMLLLTNARLQTPVWNLDDDGLNSSRVMRPVWPLLTVDGQEVADNNGTICRYANDPYTIYTDEELDLNDIISAFELSDGKLGVLEQGSSFTYFNVFDESLNRVYDHAALAENIVQGSIAPVDLGNGRILFFYKTRSGNKDQFRATIYDWNIHDILWTGSNVLWEEEQSDWKAWKLAKVDDNRYVAVSFVLEDGHYMNHQTLEYRILTLNLP
ncbi:MAG: hypothetical protein GY751_09520 [Bacteroidetes bacterium]|nr:hypothetical protein [Bacteroidota bacterium]